uniref:Uncharacterized protein n=1 Tax=mine drainage metagenome TaxID=410659 RepID=E6QW10_9ZZZZ
MRGHLLALLEHGGNIVDIQAVELFGEGKIFLTQSQLARLIGGTCQCHQARHRLTRARNDDFFARLGLIDKAGKLGLGFMDVDGLHGVPRFDLSGLMLV